MNIVEIFYFVGEFCKNFIPLWSKKLIYENIKSRNLTSVLSMSEIIAILILLHRSKYRDFKAFYMYEVCGPLKHLFSKNLPYNRFVEIEKSAIVPMLFLFYLMKKNEPKVYFIDSTPLKICHIKRLLHPSLSFHVSHIMKPHTHR